MQFQFWRLETLKKRAESVSSRILAVLSRARRWTGGRDRGNGKTGGEMRGSEWNGERNLLFYLVPTTKIQAATLSLYNNNNPHPRAEYS